MAARKIRYYQIIVEGRGIFPLDMLRYDNCFPARQEDVSLIEHNRDQRQIELASVRDRLWDATEGRWASFGWPVVSCKEV